MLKTQTGNLRNRIYLNRKFKSIWTTLSRVYFLQQRFKQMHWFIVIKSNDKQHMSSFLCFEWICCHQQYFIWNNGDILYKNSPDWVNLIPVIPRLGILVFFSDSSGQNRRVTIRFFFSFSLCPIGKTSLFVDIPWKKDFII